jgi:hypothetical protein
MRPAGGPWQVLQLLAVLTASPGKACAVWVVRKGKTATPTQSVLIANEVVLFVFIGILEVFFVVVCVYGCVAGVLRTHPAPPSL